MRHATVFLYHEQLAKWIAGKRKELRPVHMLVLSHCGRVIERVRVVSNR